MLKYILFGAGSEGKKALKLLGRKRVVAFCDNDSQKTCIDGIPVIRFQDIHQYTNDAGVVISVASPRYLIEIVRQLDEAKIDYRLLQEAANDVIGEEMEEYENLNTRKEFSVDKGIKRFIYEDRLFPAGSVTNYLWQDYWAAKHIFSKKPRLHFDIGSRIDGFISHLMVMGQEVRLIDVRPMTHNLPNVEFIEADATRLDNIADSSIESLSALCSLEHIGLGRYGDDINPDGCFECFYAIQKKMQKGGYIYISVPIGREHVEFNAHRIFSPDTIIQCFSQCDVLERAVSNENGIQYVSNSKAYKFLPKEGAGLFGLFLFIKK